MNLMLNEEQILLADSAREFLAERAPVAALRRLRDAGSGLGYEPALWTEVANLGWTAAVVPEDHGGLGFGYKGLGAVFEAMGRNLAALPMLSSIVLGAGLLAEAGSAEQCADWLPRLMAGEARLALAIDESAWHDPAAIACRATVEPAGGWRLDGAKRFVIDGVGADAFLVVARDAAGALGVFLVPATAGGLSLTATAQMDSRNAARLALDAVHVPAEARLPGGARGINAALERALDCARVCIAAETLGAAEAAFAMTVEYLKQREQFGVAIGSFQALQHRAARLYVELELLRSTVASALAAIDEDHADLPALASLTKACAADVGELLLNEAVQLHGGIGVTDAFDLGLYLKRVRVLQAALGDALFHRARWAQLHGF